MFLSTNVTLTPPQGPTPRTKGRDSQSVEPVVLDDIDWKLIAKLLEDGRIGNRALAALVGVNEATVSTRIRRLEAHGVLVFTTLIDWEAAGYEWFAIARIAVQGRSPLAVVEDISEIPSCIAASVVFGAVDVLAYFLLDDRAEVNRLVHTELAAVDGISRIRMDLATESFVTTFGGSTFLARRIHPLRLPRPAVPLDDVDVRLLDQLLANGRQSSRQIGRALGVSEGTVRTRMTRLSAASLLKPVAMLDPIVAGTAGVIADVAVRVQRGRIRAVMDAILAVPEVVFAAITIGYADISVAVAAPDRTQLLDLVLHRIRALDGVHSTETLEMVDVVQFVPYFKRLR